MGLDTTWQNFQAVEKGFRLLPAVGFRNPNDDVDAVFPFLSSGPEHRIGFAHTRGGAEEYIQLTLALTLLLRDSPVEEFVGIGSLRFHGFNIP